MTFATLGMAAVMTVAVATTCLAQGQTVPAGDSLAQTPPVDVTRKQLRAAPFPYRHRLARFGHPRSFRRGVASQYRMTR